MSRGDEMVAEMTTACDVCGLRGPHVCIFIDPAARPGLGRVFPSAMNLDGDEVYRRRDGTETAKAAARRLGVDHCWLGAVLKRLGYKREGGYWKLRPEQFDEAVRRGRAGEGDRRYGKRETCQSR